MSLRSLCHILRTMNLGPNDIFIDLGCGCGISCLVACMVFNCRSAIGIDCNSHAIAEAKRFAEAIPCPIQFHCIDMMNIKPLLSLRHVTAIYAFDSAFSIAVKSSIETKLFPLFTRARVFAVNGLQPPPGFACYHRLTVKAYKNKKHIYQQRIWLRETTLTCVGHLSLTQPESQTGTLYLLLLIF